MDEFPETLSMRPATAVAFRKILDCFSGADGGTSFMQVRWLIETMDKRASQGDQAAVQVVDIMKHFAKSIDVAAKYFKIPEL